MAGQIEFDTFSIESDRGSIDLAKEAKLVVLSMNVYESVLDHHTYCDVTVLDTADVLGTNKLAGDEKVSISFKGSNNNNSANFKFAMLQNAEMKHTSNMKGKVYELRMCSPELLNSQNKVVNKGFRDQTSKIVEKIAKDYWNTEKEVKIEQETKGKQRIVGNSVHPHKLIDQLKDRHVSQNYEEDGSVFSLHETRNSSGDQIIKFTTFKKMMDDDSGLEFGQDATIGAKATSTDDSKQILNLHIPSSFLTPHRWTAPTAKSSYNLASGKQQKDDKEFKDPKIPVSESPISGSERQKINKPSKEQKPLRHVIISPENDKDQTYIAQSKSYKAAMVARLTNDIGWMEVNGNTDLRVGSVVNLKLPNKSVNAQSGDEEKQITAKVLVTKIRHSVKPMGQDPRYTSIVEFIKAGYEEGVS